MESLREFLLETLAAEYGVPPNVKSIGEAISKTETMIWIGVKDTGILIGADAPYSNAEYGEKIRIDDVTEDAKGAALVIDRLKASLARIEEFIVTHAIEGNDG